MFWGNVISIAVIPSHPGYSNSICGLKGLFMMVQVSWFSIMWCWTLFVYTCPLPVGDIIWPSANASQQPLRQRLLGYIGEDTLCNPWRHCTAQYTAILCRASAYSFFVSLSGILRNLKRIRARNFLVQHRFPSDRHSPVQNISHRGLIMQKITSIAPGGRY